MILTSAGGHSFTLNVTEAENEFANKFLYKEIYTEFQLLLNEKTTLKGFFDRSQEPIKLENDRYAFGMYLENEWPHRLGTIVNLEYQTFEREAVQKTQKVKNYFTSFTVSHAPKFSASIVWERSTDPEETDDPATVDIETGTRNWIGYTLNYQYSNRHYVSLFFGNRRGGLACGSGICYRVLDFEGLELRINSVF